MTDYNIEDLTCLEPEEEECLHELWPTDIRQHSKDKKRMIAIWVCVKCGAHKYKTSKPIEKEKEE